MIIQFVMFFVIGFSLYLTVGNFFKYQSELFRESITQENLKLANSYITSNMITLADSCKDCDYANFTFKIENTTAGYFFDLDLSNSQVNVSVPPFENKSFITSAHNLNMSYSSQGKTISSKTLTLTLNRTKNEIGIS
jgi:hypothetical protein